MTSGRIPFVNDRQEPEAAWRHHTTREQSLEFGLLSNEPFPEGNRFGGHVIEQPLNIGALLIGQPELLNKLQYVARPGIAIQFGGQR
jgi:hypothetical protein